MVKRARDELLLTNGNSATTKPGQKRAKLDNGQPDKVTTNPISPSQSASKTIWLIDKVFPFIYKYIHYDLTQVLRCRLVSKLWCLAVDDFFEKHPSCYPYGHNNTTRCTVPYTDFNYLDLKFDVGKIPVTTVCSNNIRDTWIKFAIHSGNPFCGRSVKFMQVVEGQLENQNDYKRVGRQSQAFLSNCITFCHTFGHEIWEVDLDFAPFFPQSFEELKNIIDDLFKLLSKLPELRSLRLNMSLSEVFMSKQNINKFVMKVDKLKVDLELKHLSTLILPGVVEDSDILDFKKVIMKKLTQKCGIKKLVISEHTWQSDCQEYFPSLNELSIDMHSQNENKNCLQILQDVGTHALKKLTIQTSQEVGFNLNKLFYLLQNLSVEELQIRNAFGGAELMYQPGEISDLAIPSVKFISFRDSTVGFNANFLRIFPSLEHVQVIGTKCTETDFQTKQEIRTTGMLDKLRCYMYMRSVPMYINIWDDLKSLRLLTLNNDMVTKQFAREYKNVPFVIDSSWAKEMDNKNNVNGCMENGFTANYKC